MEEMKEEKYSSVKKVNAPLRYVITSLTVLFVVLSAASLFRSDTVTSVTSGFTAILMPMQAGINKAGATVSDSIHNIAALSEAQKENEELKAEVESLKLEINMMQQDTYEIDEFKELMDLQDQYKEYEMTGANVIAKDSGNWFHSFVIDKGSKDGIEEDMVVLAQGGLAGIVTQVGSHSAKVMSIINDDSNITAMSMSTKESCMVSGDLEVYESGRLRIMYVDKDSNISSGDKIVTSNISTKYLPGILIGYVDELSIDNNNLTRSGTLIPCVDFSNLDTVLVVTTLKDNGEELK